MTEREDFARSGVPLVTGSVERTRGRIHERSAEKVWALGEDFRPGKVVDYRFDSEEGRNLVRTVAERLELKEERGRDEKIGLYFAILGGAGAAVALLVLAVLALLDRL